MRRQASDDSVPVRQHVERLLAELTKRFDDLRASDYAAQIAALASADKAVSAALEAVKASAAQADSVAERRLIEAKEDLKHRLDALNKLREEMATKADLQIVATRVVDAVSRLDKLEAGLTGRAGGVASFIGWIVAAVSIISALVGFALLLRK